MEYKAMQEKKKTESNEDIFRDIRDCLRDRNRIEWLKAMIQYSDNSEKYKILLKSMYE